MDRLGPDLHAQASEHAATGLPLGTQAETHRRRRGSEGHFLRHKGLAEKEVTFTSVVATAPTPAPTPDMEKTLLFKRRRRRLNKGRRA